MGSLLLRIPLHILSSIIDVYGEECFDLLYATGNISLQNRMRFVPLRCDWRPSPYSDNIVSLSAVVIGQAESGEFVFDDHRLYDDYIPNSEAACSSGDGARLFKGFLPHSLRNFSITCSSATWGSLLEHIHKVEGLGVHITGDTHKFCGFPPNISSLSIHEPTPDMYTMIPQTVTSLNLTDCCSKLPVDFSLLENLESLSLDHTSPSKMRITLPSNIRRAHCSQSTLQGTCPLLEDIDASYINGKFPLVEHLYIKEGSGDLQRISDVMERIRSCKRRELVLDRQIVMCNFPFWLYEDDISLLGNYTFTQLRYGRAESPGWCFENARLIHKLFPFVTILTVGREFSMRLDTSSTIVTENGGQEWEDA